MRFGTLIPHFGEFASRDAVVGLSRKAEELGYDSLWVRDHLVWQPHGMEGNDRTFVDPFVALAAAAAVTERIQLGTAVTIPVRWPLKLAQNFASLSFVSGGRVVAGIGLGAKPEEFAAAGLDAEQREAIFQETVAILRQAWTGEVNHDGDVFQIHEIELFPKPIADIPILYGGTTPAGVRRAVRYADGWYCGRLPMATLDRRLAQILEMPEAAGRDIPKVIQPLVVIARDREDARRRIPVEEVAHSSEGSRFWVRPASGDFETLEDLRGLVVWGTPGDVADQIQEFAARGIDDFVFDFRLQYDEYPAALELVGREVLPRVRQ